MAMQWGCLVLEMYEEYVIQGITFSLFYLLESWVVWEIFLRPQSGIYILRKCEDSSWFAAKVTFSDSLVIPLPKCRPESRLRGTPFWLPFLPWLPVTANSPQSSARTYCLKLNLRAFLKYFSKPSLLTDAPLPLALWTEMLGYFCSTILSVAYNPWPCYLRRPLRSL